MKHHFTWITLPLLALLCGCHIAEKSIVADPHNLNRYEWRASTFSLSAQYQATLDVQPAGKIISVWSSRRQQAGRAGIYAQRFSPDGVALGTEISIGLSSRLHLTAPDVACGPDGTTWIIWQAHNQDSDAGSIIARHFDHELIGSPEVVVNQHRRGHQSRPAIAIGPDNTAVVVWMSSPASDARTCIRARRLGPDGQALGDEFAVSAPTHRAAAVPALAFAPDGDFLVVYSVFNQQMQPDGIRAQRFSASCSPLGPELAISGPLKNSQIEPVIACTRDGFIVAWLDAESDGADYGVLARLFDAQGQPRGAPFVVNQTHAGLQNAAAIAVAPNGRFVIAWNGADEDGTGIFAQLFATDGTRNGNEFRLNRHVAGSQALHAASGTRRLTFSPNGDLLCVWSGDAGLGDKSSVNITMLTRRELSPTDRRGINESMPPATFASAGPTPHQPPTFDPRRIDQTATRQIRRGENFGFTAIINSGWNPPDPHLAVGPNQIVAITNGAIAFFDKDGTQTFLDEIEGSGGFWGSLGTSNFVFDPEALYDPLSERFFVMAAEAYAPGARSYVLLAVSDDNDPNGTWHKYRFETTEYAGDVFDSPNIGVDAQAVYITGDALGAGSSYPVYIFDKASLLAGDPPAIQNSLTLYTTTLSAGIPPVSFDNPPALYMIEHRESYLGNTAVRLIALRDPLGSPYFTTYNLTVPSYLPPEDPPQLGTSVRPETFDARFWSVAYRAGSLWATHHVHTTRVRARWYQIAMNGWPESGNDPSLVQSGELDPGSPVRTFFNAIGVNARGDALISCARGATDEYFSMATAYRYHFDPLDTFRPLTIQQSSSGPYYEDRWGDYSAVCADPVEDHVFWAHHEYAEGNSWRTWIARIPLLANGDMNCDGDINAYDIDGFICALSPTCDYETTYPNCHRILADCNGDGDVNSYDIDRFIELVGGG
ncbi:MAG: hypothetical protein ABIG44_09475 [Planctomycetota bacterium]